MEKKPVSEVPTPNELVALRKAEHSCEVRLKRFGPDANIDDGDYVDVMLDDELGLVLGKIPEDDDVDAAPFARKFPRVNVPIRHLDERGLNIPLDDMLDDDPFLFEPLVEDGIIGLVPLGFKHEVLENAARPDNAVTWATDPDPESESAPGADETSTSGEQSQFDEFDPEPVETIAPIDTDIIDAVAQTLGHDAHTLATLVERVDAVIPDDVTPADDYDALDVDDRRVTIIPESVWEEYAAAAELGADEATAARTVFVDQANALIREAGAREYRRFEREHAAVVTAKKT